MHRLSIAILSGFLAFTGCANPSGKTAAPMSAGKADSVSNVSTLTALSDQEIAGLSVTLTEDVQHLTAQNYTEAKLITIYQGGVAAPLTSYAMIFDREPKEGGDYGTYQVFEVATSQVAYPKEASFRAEGDELILSYTGTFNDENNGYPEDVTHIIVATFKVSKAGAVETSGSVTLK